MNTSSLSVSPEAVADSGAPDVAPLAPRLTASGSLAKVGKSGKYGKGATLDLSSILRKVPAARVEAVLLARSIDDQAKMSDRALRIAGQKADALEFAGMDREDAERRALARVKASVVVGKGDKALKVSPSSLLGRALLNWGE